RRARAARRDPRTRRAPRGRAPAVRRSEAAPARRRAAEGGPSELRCDAGRAGETMPALPPHDRLRERDDRARRETRAETRDQVVRHAVGVEHELLDELEHDVLAVASAEARNTPGNTR